MLNLDGTDITNAVSNPKRKFVSTSVARSNKVFKISQEIATLVRGATGERGGDIYGSSQLMCSSGACSPPNGWGGNCNHWCCQSQYLPPTWGELQPSVPSAPPGGDSSTHFSEDQPLRPKVMNQYLKASQTKSIKQPSEKIIWWQEFEKGLKKSTKSCPLLRLHLQRK